MADVVALDVVGPLRPFDVVEVRFLHDLGWTEVLVEDDCADLDVLAYDDVGFPNRMLFVDANDVAKDIVVHLQSP